MARRYSCPHGRITEDAVRLVGQVFALVGAPDPRFTNGMVDFRLSCQHAGWRKRDLPSQRRQTILLAVLLAIAETAANSIEAHLQAASDLIYIGVKFLL